MEIQLKFIFIQSVGKVRSAFQTSSTSTIIKVATIDKSLITRNKKIRYTSTLGHDDNQFRFFIQLHIADLVRSWLENFKCKHHLLNYSIKYWKLTTTVHQIPCIHQLQIISSVDGVDCYFKSRIRMAGFSKYDFHKLENLAIVAPSITRWSADQLTFIMCVGTTWPLSSYRGSFCNMTNNKTSQHYIGNNWSTKSLPELVVSYDLSSGP